ncbi:hypothetical protein WMO64_00960 [Pseudoflavonifractor sp. CLA-AP-H29]|uniref:Anti-sigma factor RsgI-like middle domain-containing protein n=1 Tax=Pseudoflavonifractor intestinihominis TaxID=3133171 RepID=A0ABV1E572_9FIRM
MNYLVMEVHPAYAVVLDEEGRFLKAANLRYQVGDTVRDIVELRRPRGQRPALWKPLSGVAGLAACLCIVFFGYYQPNFVPYGALRIQINPDVELTLSRTDRVLELEGLNADGRVLIEGYDYGGKDREDVTEELVERAIDMGYLSGGETVSITVTSADADWQAREEQAAREDLEERYGETIVIQIGPTDEKPPVTEVVIPVTPPEPEPTPEPPPEQTDPPVVPDDTDDRPGNGGVTGYQDTDYGPYSDGVTDYESSNDGPYIDGDTDYEDRDDDRDTDDDRWEDDGDDRWEDDEDDRDDDDDDGNRDDDD